VVIGVNGHGASGGDVGILARLWETLDARVRVYIQPPTIKGKSQSLNDLMQHVCGDWIALLDCDDAWAPTKLEAQIQVLDTVARDAAVIGTHTVYFGDMQGTPTIPTGYIEPTTLLTVNPIINSSVLIRREYCRWDGAYDGIEDYELWMRIVCAGGKLYNLPQHLTAHRIHTSSAFNTKQHDLSGLRAKYAVALRALGKN
jgi:teichuronic acid biosynthesis glycosyltransferase TuaG